MLWVFSSPSPRWRILCCGCSSGLRVYAAAGRDALLNSSSRDRSRGGPGTAIVFHRITSHDATDAFYSRRQMYKHGYSKHTDSSHKGRALDRSSVGVGVPSALSHTVVNAHRMDKGRPVLYTNKHQVTWLKVVSPRPENDPHIGWTRHSSPCKHDSGGEDSNWVPSSQSEMVRPKLFWSEWEFNSCELKLKDM